MGILVRLTISIVVAFLVSVSVADAKVLSYAIGSSADDGYASVGGSSMYYVTTAPMPYSSGTRMTFMRWPIAIPANATVTAATVSMVVANGSKLPVSIDVVDLDNCPAFTTNPASYSVLGSPVVDSFTGTWSAGQTVTSPDITSLIQAYMARGGYAVGNYIALRFVYSSGSGSGNVYTVDAGATYAPTLNITYTGGDVSIDLWMAEPHVKTKQYIYPHFVNQDAGDVAYVYLDDVLKYSYTFVAGDVPANPADYVEKSYLLDYTGLTAGSHHIDVVVKTSGGATRGTTTKTWTTTHSGYPKVGIDENNAICIRNEAGTGCNLFFPLHGFMWDESRWYNCAVSGVCWPFSAALNGLDFIGYQTAHTPTTAADFIGKAAATTDPDTSKAWNVMAPGRGQYFPIARATSYILNNYSLGYFDVNTGSNGHYYKCTKAGYTNDKAVSGIGSTKTNVAHSAFNYTISSTAYWKDADAVGVALPAETVPQNKYGLYLFWVDAAGATSSTAAAGNTTGYDTSALAIAAGGFNAYGYPADREGYFYIGRVVVTSTAVGGFIAGTTNLDASGVTASYSAPLLYPPTYCTTSGCVQSDGSTEWTEQGEFAAGMVGAIASASSDCESPANAMECSYVNQLKSADGLLAWKWKDEPNIGGNTVNYSATLMKNIFDGVKAADTDHPLMYGYLGYDYQYGSNNAAGAYKYSWLTNSEYNSGTKTHFSDITGGDVYPVQFVWKGPIGNIITTLESMLSEQDSYIAYEYGMIPSITAVAPMMTGGTGAECTRTVSYPTGPQLKNELWLRVIHGVKGIIYFPFFCTIQSYQTEAAVQFKTDMETGSPTLYNVVLQPKSTKYTPENRSVYSPGTGYVTVPLNHKTTTAGADGRVDYMIREYGGKTYVFAARVKKFSGEAFETCTTTAEADRDFCTNISLPGTTTKTSIGGWPDPANTNTKSATINISDLTSSTTIKVIGENRNIAASNGSFTDDFTDYDVHIYEYEAPTEADTTAPTVTTFLLPDTSSTLEVSISSFTCTDSVGVTGYCVTTTNSSAGCSWSSTAPAAVTFAEGGEKTAYGWCKDAASNISTASTDSVIIDTSATYALTVTMAGTGSGQVTSSPVGIDCGTTCAANYAEDTVVTLTATATGDDTFTGWSGTGGCTGTGTCELTMTEAKAATATFGANQHELFIGYPTDGTVITDSNALIECGGGNYNCSYSFASGSVYLTATCATGYYNAVFSGDCTGSICTFEMDATKTISASCTNGRAANIGSGGSVSIGAGGTATLGE